MKTDIKLTDNRSDDDRRSYAFNLGSKVIDTIYFREHKMTGAKDKIALDEHYDIIIRYMLEAFIEGYTIAKEKSEERIIWK